MQNNDFIYISQVETLFSTARVIKSGADKIIKEQISKGNIYIGESIGSMML